MLKRTSLLALALFVCLHPLPAGAITIEGVEFTDPLVFDVAPDANFSLSTSEDIYVFAPNDLEARISRSMSAGSSSPPKRSR